MREAVRVWRGVRGLETKGRRDGMVGFGGRMRVFEGWRSRSRGVVFMVFPVWRGSSE